MTQPPWPTLMVSANFIGYRIDRRYTKVIIPILILTMQTGNGLKLQRYKELLAPVSVFSEFCCALGVVAWDWDRDLKHIETMAYRFYYYFLIFLLYVSILILSAENLDANYLFRILDLARSHFVWHSFILVVVEKMKWYRWFESLKWGCMAWLPTENGDGMSDGCLTYFRNFVIYIIHFKWMTNSRVVISSVVLVVKLKLLFQRRNFVVGVHHKTHNVCGYSKLWPENPFYSIFYSSFYSRSN